MQNIWIGTDEAGVARISVTKDSLSIRIFDDKDGLTSRNIYLMYFDRTGKLWVGSEKGVDQISLDAEQNFREVRYYGIAEGFLGVETCQNAVFTDRDGYVWFGTVDGVSRYLPGNEKRNTVPPRLRISEVSLFERRGTLRLLSHRDNQSRFRFWENNE